MRAQRKGQRSPAMHSQSVEQLTSCIPVSGQFPLSCTVQDLFRSRRLPIYPCRIRDAQGNAVTTRCALATLGQSVLMTKSRNASACRIRRNPGYCSLAYTFENWVYGNSTSPRNRRWRQTRDVPVLVPVRESPSSLSMTRWIASDTGLESVVGSWEIRCY